MLLADYHTEQQLAAELQEKFGKGSRRQLRAWRSQGKGPPWARVGRDVIYPNDGFQKWLRSLVRQPCNSTA